MNKNIFSFFNLLLKGQRYPSQKVQEEASEWTFTGDIFGSDNTGQATVYKVQRATSPFEQAAMKVYEKKFPKEGPPRTYREFIAMDLLKGLSHIDKTALIGQRDLQQF
jgi:hypothetical protein